MGKCLTIVKLVGIGSLGITTGVLGYASTSLIQQLLDYVRNTYLIKKSELQKATSKLVKLSRRTIIGFGSLATYLFTTAFTRAPLADKHPYLLYSAIGLPVAGAYYVYKVLPLEKDLVNVVSTIIESESQVKSDKPKTEKRTKKVKKIVKQKKQPEPSPLDNSVYNDLGEDESEEVEIEEEVEYEVPVEEGPEENSEDEIKSALIRNQLENDLPSLSREYRITGIISATSLGLALIGYVGELYFL